MAIILVFDPSVLHRLLANLGPWVRGENGEDDHVRVQLLGEIPQPLDGGMAVLPRANDHHSLHEDVVLLQDTHRFHGVLYGRTLLEVL